MSDKSVSSTMVLAALFSLFFFLGSILLPSFTYASVPETETGFVRSEQFNGGKRSFRVAPGKKQGVQDFFDRNRSEFQLSAEDKLVKRVTEEKSGTHVFQQTYKGIEVEGAGYTLWEKENAVTSGIGKLASDLDLDVKPDITKNRARELVLSRILPKVPLADIPEPSLRIVSTRPDGEFEPDTMKLAYYYESIPLRDPACSESSCPLVSPQYLYLDAETGEVLFQGDTIDYAYENVTTPIPIKNFYNQNVMIRLKKEVGVEKYVLGTLPENGLPGVTLKCWEPSQVNFWSIDKGELSDTNLADQSNFNDTECLNGKIGISIMHNMERILHFLKQNFSWHGYDGQGAIPLEVGMLPMPFSPFYDQLTRRMGVPFFQGIVEPGNGFMYKFSVDLELMAHEFMHGISHASFNPSKAFREMAAINESISDIFGLVLKNKVEPSQSWDWGAGRGAIHDAPPGLPKVLRLFSNPKKIGHPMTYDPALFQGTPEPDPHVNGEISNYWFYLLSEGSQGEKMNDKKQLYSVLPIGVDNALKILFKTVTGRYLHGADGFMQLRFATLMAAEDLAIAGELTVTLEEALASVMNAWHAVGVGDSFEAERKMSPYNGEPGVHPWPVELKWDITYPKFERKWQVQIANNPEFQGSGMTNRRQNIVFTGDPVSVSTAYFNAEPGGTYYWKVKTVEIDARECEQYAERVGRTGQRLCDGILDQWSKVSAFQTSDVVARPLTPDGTEKAWPWPAKFTWEEVKGAVGYILQFAEQPFTPEQDEVKEAQIEDENGEFFNLMAPAVSSGVQSFERTLKVDAQYYWRVLPVGPKEGFWKPDVLSQGSRTAGSWSNEGEGIPFETSLPKTSIGAPDGYQTFSPWNVYVAWEKVKGATKYETSIARDAFFLDLIPPHDIKVNLPTATTELVSLPQDYDQQPLWLQMIPIGPAPYHERGDSTIASFSIDYERTRPELMKPAPNLEISHGQDVHFDWSDVQGSTSYHLLVNEGDFFQEPPSHLSSYSSALTVDAGAAASHESGYCWTVRSVGPASLPGLAAEPQCYDVGPSVPSIFQPAHKATTYNITPFDFIWRNDFAPSGFVIRLKKKIGNTYQTVLDDLDIGQAEAAPGGGYRYTLNSIEPNTHYHWRIGAKKSNGQVQWFPPLDQGGYEFITRPNLEPPRITSVVPGQTSAEIWWSDLNPYPLSHTIALTNKTNGQTVRVNIPETGQYTIQGLTAGTQYEVVLSNTFKNNLKFSDGTAAKNSENFSNPPKLFTTLQPSAPTGPLRFILREGTLSDFNMKVWDPSGFLVSTDIYADNVAHLYVDTLSQSAGPDIATFPNPIPGNYCVRVFPEYGNNTATSFTLDVYRGDQHVQTLVSNQPVSAQENNGGSGKYWPSATGCYIYTNS